jgi:hypothetical protein
MRFIIMTSSLVLLALGVGGAQRDQPATADQLAQTKQLRAMVQEPGTITDFERFFLRRQRAMHAWDITVFEDFGAVAKNPTLRRYVADTRAPLAKHADMVVQLSNKRGIPGGLTTIQSGGRN